MRLTHLRTLNMTNPLGIDTTPYFSWELADGLDDTIQTHYQIRVFVKGSGTCVWDSGKTASPQTSFVPYKGALLESKTTYVWYLHVWGNGEQFAESSASFETAMCHDSDWMSEWAEADNKIPKRKKGFGNQPSPTMFRKNFSLTEFPEKARLYITCHGVYRLTINGERVDGREFAPEYSSYDKYLCYQTYDILPFLCKGENVIGLYVGDGWYFNPITAMSKKDIQKPHAVLFQLELTNSEGAVRLVTSGDGVKTSTGPVLFSDLFAGERYDARRENPGWDRPGFDDSGWKPAKTAALGFKNLAAQIGEPVTVAAEIPAVKTYISPKGEQIVDFGQNIAGRVRMHVNAPAGTQITLEHFEVTDPEGNFFNNIMSAGGVGEGVDQKVEYISNGTERDFEEIFSYQGFRYVRVSGLSEIRKEDFTAVALSSEMENTGTFECSDERLNRLYKNIRWSQRSNMLSIPTDCPQREKAGWAGDIAIYAETSLLNADTTVFLTRWLHSLSADQEKNGAVPMVIPFNQNYRNTAKFMGLAGGSFGSFGIAGWGDAAVIVPYTMYRVTGNKEILKQQYDSMKSWCDYMIQAAEKRGDKKLPAEKEKYLWNSGFQYGEWLIPSESKNGLDFKNMKATLAGTAKYTAPIYEYYSLTLMAETADVLGKENDAKIYRKISEHVKDAIMTCLIDTSGRIDIPKEHMGAYVLLLHFDLVPEKLRDDFTQRLVQMIHNNGDRLDTGFLATPFLLDVLEQNGHLDLAYALLYQEKAPSWLYEVKNGATTIWESWYSIKEDGTPATLSMNHYAFGCVAKWMFRVIGGIDSENPGFQKIILCPKPDDHLTWAKRTFRSENGWIKCDWEKTESKFSLRAQIPCNTKALIILPDGSRYSVGSGSHEFSCGLS